jgi:polyribonucleotide nucleotidyltransferase
MREALQKARNARLRILDAMNATIPKHREQLSQYAPRIITIHIDPSRIGDVIGPGGKIIRAIVEETGAKVDIEDDGTVLIASVDAEAGMKAKERIEAITQEAEVGKIYKGIVRRVTNFGAFVEIFPGTEGLLHISEIDTRRIEQVEDVLKLGDSVEVKCISVDSDGKIRLSRRAIIEGDNGRPRPPRSGGGGRGGEGRGGGGNRRGGDHRREKSHNR